MSGFRGFTLKYFLPKTLKPWPYTESVHCRILAGLGWAAITAELAWHLCPLQKLLEFDKDKLDDALLKKIAKFTVVGGQGQDWENQQGRQGSEEKRCVAPFPTCQATPDGHRVVG